MTDKLNEKIEELKSLTRLNELLNKNQVEEKKKNTVIGIFAGIGIVAIIAGLAYAAYCFFTPDYIDDFDDDFEDDFEDDYFEED